MITRPRFRGDLLPVLMPGAGMFLLSESLPTVLNGRLNELVCPLIDGIRSTDDIVDALKGTVSPAEVYFALATLQKRMFIEEVLPDVPAAESAFWSACGVDVITARRRLQACPVRVESVGLVDASGAIEALRGAGVTVLEPADPRSPSLVVVVTDDYRHQAIEELDVRYRGESVPMALVKPVGWLPWLGPILLPDSGPCVACLVDRVRLNYTADTLVETTIGQVPVTAVASLPASLSAMLSRFALEIAKWIALEGQSPMLAGLYTQPLISMEMKRHAVNARPQCPRCGVEPYRSRQAHLREPEPIEFVSQPLRATADGGHRTATPEETLGRYEHLVSAITGVVSQLENVSPPGNPVVHAYSASHNWATRPDSLAFLKDSLRSKSGGKGTTEVQARVGAMAEAFERYSGVFRGDEIRRRGFMDEFGDAAVHPHDVLLFSERQYARRREINMEGNSFQMVTDPFDPDKPADWSPMWAPTSGETRWLPTGLLYYSYNKGIAHDTPNRMAYYADSNGCAAGNTREEAALQALLELAERDAVASWWYNELRRPGVDLNDIMTPYLADLLEWLDGEGRDLWVLDITNDIGIPVFAAFSRKRVADANGAEQLVVGFGAHLDPKIGMMRAITEVNQFFASLYALEDGDLRKAFDPGAVEWWSTASVANKAYSVPLPGDLLRLSQLPDLSSHDLLDEVQTTIRQIESRGLEVLLLDQTRPDVGFPVIKALVPGMRHFWARLAPGRLYDVPVDLGWLASRRDESGLNQTPVFF